LRRGPKILSLLVFRSDRPITVEKFHALGGARSPEHINTCEALRSAPEAHFKAKLEAILDAYAAVEEVALMLVLSPN
jgi:hypothetical protein